jgi:uncharacterized membrane protein YccC
MITVSIMTLLYFLPTIVAGRRGHEVLWPLLLNVFIGWTVIGWIALFLWALLWEPRHYYVPAGYHAPYRR